MSWQTRAELIAANQELSTANGKFYAEILKLRKENAKRRTHANELRQQLAEAMARADALEWAMMIKEMAKNE